MEIRVLARQGRSIKAIARELGLSRNTVRKYLRNGESPRYMPRHPQPTKLDPYKAYLQERIEAARPHRIPAMVLLCEIQALGFAGGISQIKSYLAPFKRRTEEPLIRFETPLGEQMQVDFTTIRRGRSRPSSSPSATAEPLSCASPNERTARRSLRGSRRPSTISGAYHRRRYSTTPSQSSPSGMRLATASTAGIQPWPIWRIPMAFGPESVARTGPRPKARLSASTATSRAAL